jgi:hypothetical protein
MTRLSDYQRRRARRDRAERVVAWIAVILVGLAIDAGLWLVWSTAWHALGAR